MFLHVLQFMQSMCILQKQIICISILKVHCNKSKKPTSWYGYSANEKA
uniref:Uncharacterized protein n=1 Tax=Arundo donax TaxID=35708 RepID=A0A0A9FM40_ARUDO